MADLGKKVEVIRTTVALPAAGAFDPTPTPVLCQEYNYFTLLINYERGDLGGAVAFYPEFSMDGTTWYRRTLYEADTLAINTDAESMIQAEIVIYGATDAAEEFIVYGPVELGEIANWIRIPFAESGVVGTPGDCGATLILTRK